jgi:hypothetical protein
MRGQLTKIFGDRYLVQCDELSELIVILASDIEPPGMNHNLKSWIGNSNGDQWALGGHIEFELVAGTCLVQRAGVCLQGR